MNAAEACELVEFIKARIDEDERVAETIRDGGYAPQIWRVLEGTERDDLDGPGEVFVQVHAFVRDIDAPRGTERNEGDIVGWVYNGRRQAWHVARWDPDRVLRGIEAKRKLIDTVMAWEHELLHTGCEENVGPFPCSRDGIECDPVMCGVGEKQDQVLRALAAEFAGHEDYQKEPWAL